MAQKDHDCDNGSMEGDEECDDGPDGSPTCSPDCKSRSLIRCGQVVHQDEPVHASLPQPFVIDLQGNEGTFWFAFDTVVVKDGIDIHRGDMGIAGPLLWSTGCVGAQGGEHVTIGPGSNFVTVIVYPNCGNTTDTAFAFLVDWLTEGQPDPPDPPPEG